MNYDRMNRLIRETRGYKQKGILDAYSGIGEIIKKKREEMSLTQESFSTGICSISYLSKVENNRMSPNKYFVEEMSKKCGINLELCSNEFEDSRVLKRAFKAFYQNDLIILESLINEAHELELTRTCFLCSLCYNVSLKNHKESRDIIRELEQKLSTFDQDMLEVFSTLCVIHAFQTSAYVEALTLLDAIGNKNSFDAYATALNHTYAFLIKQKLQRKTDSIRHYSEALSSLNHYHQTDYLSMLRLYHIDFLISESPKEALKEFEELSLKRIAKELYNMYHYLKMCLLPKKTLTIDSIQMLDDTLKDHWFYKALLLVAPRNIDDVKHYFKHTNEDSLLEKVRFQSLIYHDALEYKRYLRDICLPLAIEKQEVSYINFFSEELIALSCENARYKEALAIYTKQTKALTKITSQNTA